MDKNGYDVGKGQNFLLFNGLKTANSFFSFAKKAKSLIFFLKKSYRNETVNIYYLCVPYFLWSNKSEDVKAEKVRSGGSKKIRINSIEQPSMSWENISRVFDSGISFHH